MFWRVATVTNCSSTRCGPAACTQIRMTMLFLFLVLQYAIAGTIQENIDRACTVYCEGDILNQIQLSGIFNDSKTFVDMPMKFDPEEVWTNFNQIADVNKESLLQFLDENFLTAGSDSEKWVPSDYSTTPAFLERITDPEIQHWGQELNNLWLLLGKKVSDDVSVNPQRHSYLPRSHPMIVPGGRFRESYYWDSYWIIRGLLVCGMTNTSWGVIANLLEDVTNFNFIPNGGRIYYLDRSQPPLLSDMVAAYSTAIGWGSPEGFSKLQQAVPLLEAEHQWWMSTHAVTIDSYTLNRYTSSEFTSRPESYKEDYTTCNTFTTPATCYHNIRSGAETGWDFSSRWLSSPYASMIDIDTSDIVPVDLNSILYRMELNIAAMIAFIKARDGDFVTLQPASYYITAAHNRFLAIDKLLWDDSSSRWFDYNLTSSALKKDITTVASWIPMWAGIASNQATHQAYLTSPLQPLEHFDDLLQGIITGRRTPSLPTTATAATTAAADLASRLVESLRASGLVQVAGVLTTTQPTGQQWDSPNAWPPLVLFTIEGLQLLGHPSATSLAATISSAWLQTCYLAFSKSGFMYEKYNAFEMGSGGGGGEYVPQIGFGWSNGVALSLLAAAYPPATDDHSQPNSKLLLGVTISLSIVLVASIVSAIYCFSRSSLRQPRKDKFAQPLYTRITNIDNALLLPVAEVDVEMDSDTA